MWPDRVSNPGPPTYESGALPIALRGPAIVNVNNSHKINKTVSCLAKTQPQPFLSNGILMILCVNVPIFCAYSIIRHALHLFCFTAKHAIVRIFQKRPFLIAFFVFDRHVGTSFSEG